MATALERIGRALRINGTVEPPPLVAQPPAPDPARRIYGPEDEVGGLPGWFVREFEVEMAAEGWRHDDSDQQHALAHSAARSMARIVTRMRDRGQDMSVLDSTAAPALAGGGMRQVTA